MKSKKSAFPANIFLFKAYNRNTWKRCEICSELTIKHKNDVSRSRDLIINFEHISQIFLVFLLLTLKKQMIARLPQVYKVYSDLLKSYFYAKDWEIH